MRFFAWANPPRLRVCVRSLGRLLAILGFVLLTPRVASAYQWSATALIDNVQDMMTLAKIISLFLGICMFLSSIFQFKKVMEARAMMGARPLTGPILTLVAAMGFMTLPTMMHTFVFTIFGSDSPLSYSGESGLAGAANAMNAVILLLRFLGVVSIIRGFIYLARAGKENSQPGQIGKSVMYMVGGALLFHIMGTYELIKSAIGFLN